MRAILVGSDHERDRVRWQLEDSGVTVVGEFATVTDARAAGIDADAFILAAGAGGGPRRQAQASPSTRPDDVSRDVGAEPLTPRELEVLALLTEGHSNKAIASRLGISDQTVKFHVASIIGKLGASNRTDAVRRALRRGLIAL